MLRFQIADSPTKSFFTFMISVFVTGLLVSTAVIFGQQKNIAETKTLGVTTVVPNSYDVVVVGGGEAGVGAAIAASRQGMRVALLEETDWIGGMMTAAGVTSMDGNNGYLTTGLYKEFSDRIEKYYTQKGKSTHTCYWSGSGRCFEPSVGKMVLNQMIDEAKSTGVLDVFLRTYPVSVVKDVRRIGGLTTQNGKQFTGKIFIDATEYGDLLTLSGAKYRAGNSTSDALNSNACVQDITYTAVMKKYPNGVPSGLFMSTPPPGYTSDIQKTFASIMNSTNWPHHNAYRGMPDSSNPENYTAADEAKITKTGINWANDYPFGEKMKSLGINPVKLNMTVSDLDRANRKNVFCDAKLRTLQFIYYVQHDLGQTDWAIANDEGYDTAYNIEDNNCTNIPAEFKTIEKYFPQIPYIREGRRVVGMYTLTAGDIKRIGQPGSIQAVKKFPDSLAVGDYPNDLHSCNGDSTLENDLETLADMPTLYPFAGGPFQVPFGSFIPYDTNGLLVAGKNLSVTRLANGATRNQPISMLTGQASGVIAALSIKKNVQPRKLDVFEVQKTLLDGKSMLWPFTDVGIDDIFFKSVQELAVKNIMIGYGNLKFGREDQLSRRQMAMVLSRMAGLPLDPAPTTSTFSDVPTSDLAFKEIGAVYKAGITSGCSDNPKNYCPDMKVTRAQAVTFLVKAWQKINPTLQLLNPAVPTFGDVPKTHWAYTSVETLNKKTSLICAGLVGHFCPATVMTRGAISSWITIVMNW